MQTLPAIRGVTPQIEAFSQPARTFTGDFYYAHRAENRLWFAVGDVAGKGLPAAVVMAMIQEELEHRVTSCAASECPPQVTMKRLHDFLLPHMPPNRFATAVLGHLHDDGTLTIVNAGHCPPLIARRDGTVSVLPSTGPVLGILRGSQWSAIETRLENDETLLLYSDGVIESMSDGEELGVEGVISLLQRLGASPRAIAEALDVINDDVTIVSVRRGGTAPQDLFGPSSGLRPPSPRTRGEGQQIERSREAWLLPLAPRQRGEGGRRPGEGQSPTRIRRSGM